MNTTKKTAKEKQVDKGAGPTACRPRMPSEYGIPKGKKGLLPWSHVAERMDKARIYWICTVSPDGRPHATPVDGVWLDDKLYFGGSPQTRRNRNLAANPAICVHLESGTDVVILHGEAHEMQAPDRSLTVRVAEASAKKYGYGWKPEDYEKTPGMFIFHPRMVLAWKQFPMDATRWQVQDAG